MPNKQLSHTVLSDMLGSTFDVHVYAQAASTNTLARKLADNGAKEGTVVLADTQTQGRGRMGRQFFSPDGSGLYMSVILRPQTDTPVLYITTAAAVAVAEAIEQLTDEKTAIKWVNDVYLRNKKVCGILTEGVYANGLQYAILGIGVNVTAPQGGFPADIAARAGTVFDGTEPLSEFVREQLAMAIIERFWAYYKQLSAKTFLPSYRTRDFLKDRTVEVLDVNGTVMDIVTAQGITDEFGLLVKDKDDNTTVLSSGEVSLRL